MERTRVLAWMGSLHLAVGDRRGAHGYLLELLAWCAFSDRELDSEGRLADEC